MPPDATPVPEIVCEGDTDRAIYEALVRGGLLPKLDAYPKKGVSRGGLGSQVERIRAMVSFGRTRLIVARDLDDARDGSTLLRSLVRDLGAEASAISEQAPFLLQVRDCRIALVPQGQPGAPLLHKYSVSRYAVDDYLLMLLEQNVGVAGALFKDEGERNRAFAKMDEVRRLMISQGYAVSTSKRLVFLLKAIVDFGVAPATLAEQTIEVTPADVVQRVFQPLVDAVKAADQALA